VGEGVSCDVLTEAPGRKLVGLGIGELAAASVFVPTDTTPANSSEHPDPHASCDTWSVDEPGLPPAASQAVPGSAVGSLGTAGSTRQSLGLWIG